MKLRIGDKVKIKSLEWYEEEQKKKKPVTEYSPFFTREMTQYCGTEQEVESFTNGFVRLKDIGYIWSRIWFEGFNPVTPEELKRIREGADLQGADLQGAGLRGADLRGAHLQGADLRGADLRGADYGCLQCPSEGAFIAWKKCRDGILVKLLIPEEAKRSSATSRKCRADKAVVIDIIGADEAVSQHDDNFIYRKGETVLPKEPFNEDRWVECGSGIHFFITKEEAEKY
ncbi:MAG: DUF5758 domain-containing protein [Treponema sp.]|jgi:hypothetical protein|nr:DUF5758 domain-containing protein [Treponema sp.]